MNRRQFLGTVGTASITSGLTAFSLNQISENETQGEVKQIATDKISVDIVNLRIPEEEQWNRTHFIVPEITNNTDKILKHLETEIHYFNDDTHMFTSHHDFTVFKSNTSAKVKKYNQEGIIIDNFKKCNNIVVYMKGSYRSNEEWETFEITREKEFNPIDYI